MIPKFKIRSRDITWSQLLAGSSQESCLWLSSTQLELRHTFTNGTCPTYNRGFLGFFGPSPNKLSAKHGRCRLPRERWLFKKQPPYRQVLGCHQHLGPMRNDATWRSPALVAQKHLEKETAKQNYDSWWWLINVDSWFKSNIFLGTFVSLEIFWGHLKLVSTSSASLYSTVPYCAP